MEIAYSSEFKRAIRKLSRRYRSLRADIEVVLSALQAGETPGDRLQNTPYSTFKVRVKNSDAQKGKSGGYRVIYYVQHKDKTILVTLYSKSDQSDISPEEVHRIIESCDVLE